jgi:Na+-driven multidrug efflux pump
MLLRSFSAIVLTKIVALFGTVVLAAYGVGGRIFHLFLFPGFGFGGASATLVGQNLGAKNPERAYKSATLSSFYYFIFLFFTGILVFIFADSVAKFFNPEKEFVKIASIYFRYISAGSIFLCLGVVFSQSLQGAGETVLPMLLTGLTLYVIQIPLAYFLSNHFQLKETGIWIAGFVGSFSNAILMSMAFFSGRWKHKKI